MLPKYREFYYTVMNAAIIRMLTLVSPEHVLVHILRGSTLKDLAKIDTREPHSISLPGLVVRPGSSSISKSRSPIDLLGYHLHHGPTTLALEEGSSDPALVSSASLALSCGFLLEDVTAVLVREPVPPGHQPRDWGPWVYSYHPTAC